MPDILQLQDLYNEALVRETYEKTLSCGLTWNYLGGTQFQATEVDSTQSPPITWDFFLTQTQTGNVTYKYTFDVKQNGVSYITINDGPLPYTNRDSTVKQLFETVQLIVLQMDTQIKTALRFVQNISDCQNPSS